MYIHTCIAASVNQDILKVRTTEQSSSLLIIFSSLFIQHHFGLPSFNTSHSAPINISTFAIIIKYASLAISHSSTGCNVECAQLFNITLLIMKCYHIAKSECPER